MKSKAISCNWPHYREGRKARRDLGLHVDALKGDGVDAGDGQGVKFPRFSRKTIACRFSLAQSGRRG